MAETELPRDELAAAVEARKELGRDLEPQVIDGFLEKVEKAIDARVEQRVRERLPAKSHGVKPQEFALGSLGISIPLIAVAGIFAGLAGIAAVCVAIVLVNLIVLRS
jgi:hypothetical protein